MEDFKFKSHLFLAITAIMFLTLIPGKCFASSSGQSISVSESRVYRERLITEAKKYIGCPYVRGATGPDKFDCSGLVGYVSSNAIGIQLPRTVKAMYSYVKIIPDAQREPGDLVFFRTTNDGSISHVGLYIGNGQFISAVSDGPNTGVILSSLQESYWKTHYASSGKFLAAANYYDNAEEAKQSQQTADSAGTSGGSFLHKLAFNATLTGDWSLFTEKRFMPNFRGISSQTNLVYDGTVLDPGVGLMLRWNYGVKTFQIPVLFSLGFGDYVRAYAGPVFTLGTCYEPDTDDEISASIFPGIIGITFQTPSLTKGIAKIRIIQDLNYSIFNNTKNAALSPLRSAAAGFELSTGVSVTFPFAKFFNK